MGHRVNAGSTMVTRQVHLSPRGQWGILGNKINTHTHGQTDKIMQVFMSMHDIGNKQVSRQR